MDTPQDILTGMWLLVCMWWIASRVCLVDPPQDILTGMWLLVCMW